MKRSAAYIEAGRQKIRKAPAYDMSIEEMNYYIKSIAAGNECLPRIFKALADVFLMGVEAGYRIKSKEK